MDSIGGSSLLCAHCASPSKQSKPKLTIETLDERAKNEENKKQKRVMSCEASEKRFT